MVTGPCRCRPSVDALERPARCLDAGGGRSGWTQAPAARVCVPCPTSARAAFLEGMTTIESQPAPAIASPSRIALRIDEVMPRFDVNVVQHIVVNAGPLETYQAVLDAD